MNAEKKTFIVTCPVSIEYKVILDPQKTFKSDGVISQGKRVYFRGGRAEVDEETLSQLKQLPEWGIDFMEASPEAKVAQPLQPTPTTLGSDLKKEQDKGQLEMLSKQVSALTEAMGQILENMSKK